MDMGKFPGLVTHEQKPLGRVLKLILMNLDDNKFTENTFEPIMQINHNEELSILSDSSPLPVQFVEWNVRCCEYSSSFVKESND